MEDVDIVWLKAQRLLIILVRLDIIPHLIITKSPIKQGFKMLRVDLQRRAIIPNSLIKDLLLSIGKPSVVIEIRLTRIKLDGDGEVVDGGLVVTLAVVGDPSVVVGVGVFRVDFDSH